MISMMDRRIFPENDTETICGLNQTIMWNHRKWFIQTRHWRVLKVYFPPAAISFIILRIGIVTCVFQILRKLNVL